jgi:hypothetical protein
MAKLIEFWDVEIKFNILIVAISIRRCNKFRGISCQLAVNLSRNEIVAISENNDFLV